MKKLLILITASLALCACSTVNTVERADPLAQKKMVNDKRIITDSDLEDYAYIAGVNETKVGNLLKIQVQIVNSSSAYRSVNYKFTWIDANGMEVPAPNAPWGVLTIEGGEMKYISGVAPSPNVVDFSLKLLPNMR